jgi:3-methyladenine DNA glycosylase AlkD
MTAREVQEQLRGLSSPEAAALAARFFKTGPGQYGEGDIFLGLRAAEMHKLAKKHRQLPFDELKLLLRSAIHEDRLLALLILVLRTSRSDESTKKQVYDLYLGHTRYINNWDLVDASAREIVGGYLAIWRYHGICGNGGSVSSRLIISFVKTTSMTRSGLPSNCWATERT